MSNSPFNELYAIKSSLAARKPLVQKAVGVLEKNGALKKLD